MIDAKLNKIFKSLSGTWSNYSNYFKVEKGVLTYTNGRILIMLDLPMEYRNDLGDGVYSLKDHSPAPQVKYPNTEHFLDKKIYSFDIPLPALTTLMTLGVTYKYPKKKTILITKHGRLFDGGDKSFASDELSLTAEYFNIMANLGVKEISISSKNIGVYFGVGEFDGLAVKVIAVGGSTAN